MAYTKTSWSETGLDTATKLIALNNAENQYDECSSYLASLTHLSNYYTKIEADALYFSAATDGAGSGLVCETLDSYTYEDIINSAIPSNVIAMWGQALGDIPAGWHECDGTQGTPDLRDKFVPGAGGAYYSGLTGGSSIVTSTATLSVGYTALSAAQIPAHDHQITDNYGYPNAYTSDRYYGPAGYRYHSNDQHDEYKTTGYTGGSQGHTHSGSSFTGTIGQSKLPPYLALYYIMKL